MPPLFSSRVRAFYAAEALFADVFRDFGRAGRAEEDDPSLADAGEVAVVPLEAAHQLVHWREGGGLDLDVDALRPLPPPSFNVVDAVVGAGVVGVVHNEVDEAEMDPTILASGVKPLRGADLLDSVLHLAG